MLNNSKNKLTDKTYWDNAYSRFHVKTINTCIFASIFSRLLSKNSKIRILEIGCGGGDFLCYFTKVFNYLPYGLDFSDGIEKTKATFKFNGLPEPTLYKEDLFNWRSDVTFDIVCSFGFVEHFIDSDLIFKKHVDLLSKGGLLIISIPNLKKIQYLLHYISDGPTLNIHNFDIMSLKKIEKICNGLNLRIIYLNYYKTFDFWADSNSLIAKNLSFLIAKISQLINLFFGDNHPNAVLSPHIVCIAKKIN